MHVWWAHLFALYPGAYGPVMDLGRSEIAMGRASSCSGARCAAGRKLLCTS